MSKRSQRSAEKTPMDDPGSERDPVELLAAEFVERQRRGEHPTIEEYVADHPDLAEEIRDLFPTIAAVERLKVDKERSSGGRVFLGVVHLERLGDFRIIREIGRGGMGIVYEAEQESLGRRVAVKVLPRQSLLDPKRLRRFQREARMAAKLHHTNIVPVFGVGQQDSYHYIVMQMIRGVGLDEILSRLGRAGHGGAAAATPSDGERSPHPKQRTSEVERVARTLIDGRFERLQQPGSSADGQDSHNALSDDQQPSDSDSHPPSPNSGVPRADVTGSETGAYRSTDGQPDWVTQTPLPPTGHQYWRSVAGIGEQIADALEYAHTQGTIHRDIKPANLLVDAWGVVWITDFGLAKATEPDGVSQAGDVVGTLRYMAPEQLHGQADVRSDVYSLGATLYELLTLRAVFEAPDRSHLIRKIAQEEPTPAAKVNPAIPRDLETVVQKAIARDPNHRYQSAGEMADDLRRFHEDRPIRARRTSGPERLWRWCQRNRAIAGLSGAAMTLLVVVAVLASVGYVRAKKDEQRVRDALAGESRQRQRAEATLVLALEAVDTIFEKLAPRSVMSPAELTVESSDGERIDVPSVPVLSKEAANLLEHMRVFYDRLAEHGGDDAQMRQRVAAANRRIGDIHQQLGQYEEAKEAYAKALEGYEQLDAEDRDNQHLELERIGIYQELATLNWAAGEPEQARNACLSALAILDAAPSERSTLPEHRFARARTYYLLARRAGPATGHPPLSPHPERPERLPPRRAAAPAPRLDRESGPRDHRLSPDRDEPRLEKTIELLENLAAEYPGVPDYRHLLARCYCDLPAQPSHGDHEERLDGQARATEILQQLVEDYPGVPEYRHDLSETYARLDSFGPNPSDRDLSTAKERLRVALGISQALVAEHPNIPNYVASQVHIHHKLADVLRRAGQLESAETSLRRALELQSALHVQFPEVTPYQVWLATIQGSLARLLRDRDRFEEARSLVETSVDSLKEVLETEPEFEHVRGLLVDDYVCLADILIRLGENELAVEARHEARRWGRPRSAAPPQTGLLCNDEGAFEGYTLFAPLRSTTTYLINMAGQVVHTWESAYDPGQSAYLLDCGDLLRCARDPENPVFHGGGLGGRVQRTDWDGHVVWEYAYSNEQHCQHHDIARLPNGNVLMIAWERKTEEEALAAGRDPALLQGGELWPDHVIEVEPCTQGGGEIVWQWHVWDHLIQDHDPTKANYGEVADHPELIDVNFSATPGPLPPAELRRLQSLGYIGGSPAHGRGEMRPDWNHTNAIAYNAELDQIVLTVLGFNEIWVIDHSTTTAEAASHSGGRSGRGGDLLYRWGNPKAYRADTAADQQLFGPHDGHWVASGPPGEGHLLVFNNGLGRPDGDYSSVIELTPPVDAAGQYILDKAAGYGPAEAAWHYTSPRKLDFFSERVSGAQRLPNGNTLICSGEGGRFFEVDAHERIVWEYVNPFGHPRQPPGVPHDGPEGVLPGGPLHPPPGLGPPPRQDRPRGERPRDAGPLGRNGPPGGPAGPNAVFRAIRYAPDHPGLSERRLEPSEE